MNMETKPPQDCQHCREMNRQRPAVVTMELTQDEDGADHASLTTLSLCGPCIVAYDHWAERNPGRSRIQHARGI